jgi:hypothetical protein
MLAGLTFDLLFWRQAGQTPFQQPSTRRTEQIQGVETEFRGRNAAGERQQSQAVVMMITV